MDHNRDLRRRRQRKALCNRRKLLRRGDRPRLAVNRSLKNISAQIIDDLAGRTIAAASSREAAIARPDEGGKKGVAGSVGSALAERAREAGVTKVVFDRRHYKYHGRIKALADAARKGGLEF